MTAGGGEREYQGLNESYRLAMDSCGSACAPIRMREAPKPCGTPRREVTFALTTERENRLVRILAERRDEED